MYVKILESLKEDIRKKQKKQNVIAKKLNISTELLNQYLSNKLKIKFPVFLALLLEVYGDDVKAIKETMKKFINYTPRLENIRESLEWSSQNGDYVLFEISLHRAYAEPKLFETAKCYQLLLDRRKRDRDLTVIFDDVEELKCKVKSNENLCLLSLLSLNISDDLNKSNSIILYSRSVQRRIDNLKNGFIKTSYQARLDELLAVAYMKNGDTIEAIKRAEQHIQKGSHIISEIIMTCILAQAYLFIDEEKSVYYIEQSLEMFNENKIIEYKTLEHSLKSTHDFIKIHFSIFTHLYLEDEAEAAHFYAKVGNKELAFEKLKRLEEKSGYLSAFQLYYKALASNKREDYIKAKKAFIRNVDLHFCNLIQDVGYF